MLEKKQQLFPTETGKSSDKQQDKKKEEEVQRQVKKEETSLQKKVRKARESRTILRQIDRLEKEIFSEEKKTSLKKEKLNELANKL